MASQRTKEDEEWELFLRQISESSGPEVGTHYTHRVDVHSLRCKECGSKRRKVLSKPCAGRFRDERTQPETHKPWNNNVQD
jgi:hypothetical protein